MFCIFRFTLILSSKKSSITPIATPRRSERYSVDSGGSIDDLAKLFPKECFICNKYRLQRNKKNEFTRLLTTKEGENTVKIASKEKLPTFYNENHDTDLIARELKFHTSCYQTFTIGYSKGFVGNDSCITLSPQHD